MINYKWVLAVGLFGLVLGFSDAKPVFAAILLFMFSAVDLIGSPFISTKNNE